MWINWLISVIALDDFCVDFVLLILIKSTHLTIIRKRRETAVFFKSKKKEGKRMIKSFSFSFSICAVLLSNNY